MSLARCGGSSGISRPTVGPVRPPVLGHQVVAAAIAWVVSEGCHRASLPAGERVANPT